MGKRKSRKANISSKSRVDLREDGEEVSAKPPIENTPIEKVGEKQDLFLSFSDKAINFISSNRKSILIGFAVLSVIVVLIFIFSLVSSKEREKVSNSFYGANLNIFDKIKDAEDEITGGAKITDDEVVRLVKENKKLIANTEDKNTQEVYLAKYILGITYYSIGDYDNASYYFKEVYKHKDDFHLAFQGLLNLGHSLFNRGYNYDKQGKKKKALESYKAAVLTYKKFTDEFPKSPSIVLAYRYLGLLSETLARLYTNMEDDKKSINTLLESKKYYEKYLELAKNKEGKLQADFMSTVFMRRSIVHDASISIRRVQIKLDKNK